MPAKNALLSWRGALAISIHSALVACGPPFQRARMLDIPELASVDYLAIAQEGADDAHEWSGRHAIAIVHEQGAFQCVAHLDEREPIASCPEYLRRALLEARRRSIIVADAEGRPAIFAEPPSRIDTPERAIARVWFSTYETSIWMNGTFSGAWSGYVRPTGEGYEVLVHDSDSDAHGDCGSRRTIVSRYYHRVVLVRRDGTIEPRGRHLAHQESREDPCHPGGRRPQDFADIPSGHTVSGHLRRAMHHEAESVRAFLRFARELEAYRAPRDLVEAAHAAAADERRHAWAMARLAGATPTIAEDDLPIRPLAECALENAVEGCLLESFAAALAAHQALHARSGALRSCFVHIGEDEIRHAALAHAARDFFDAQLSAGERAARRRAVQRACGELEASLRDPTDAERILGYPDRASARRLLHAVTRASAS